MTTEAEPNGSAFDCPDLDDTFFQWLRLPVALISAIKPREIFKNRCHFGMIWSVSTFARFSAATIPRCV